MTLWSSQEAAKITGGETAKDWQANGVSIDSRLVRKGDLFVALVGENNDGHDYVAQAFKNGASAALVSRVPDGCDDKPLLKVDDTFTALQALAAAARARCGGKIIGITGSVGKTGTKELLATAFGALGQTHASSKSYNNMWGVPLSLSNLHEGTDYGIFEMGMNHPDEITPLTTQVKPHIAIITTVQSVHVENFENGMEGIADAKAEIFDGLEEGGTAVLNCDNEWFDHLKAKAESKGAKVVSFGEAEGADARLLECLEAANGSRIKADIMGETVEYSLQIAGRHIAQNSLAVLLAVKLAGGNLQKAAKALAKQQAIAGRGAREQLDSGEKGNPITLIDESYNASPPSMRAAFKVLALVDPGRGGRRIAILGDMLELGKNAPQMHADLALPLKAADVDLVYTCGKNMKNLHDNLPANQRGEYRKTSEELAQIVPDVLIPGDVVMVKGSLGSKMGVIVEALRALPANIKKGKVGHSNAL